MGNSSGKHSPEVSIIIPCKKFDEDAKRCYKACNQIIDDKEIIVVTDEDCPGYPAAKRNWAMARAKGRIFAFIDSDAYPSYGWMIAARHWLKTYNAVCGPGMLPHDAPHAERMADIVYQMLPYAYRVFPMAQRLVPEYPTFNLIVLREVATQFENYLTGEDSLFCRKIKGGIFYHPDILVYHNRRPVYKRLWKQVGTYGLHRGNFIRQALCAWLSTIFVYVVNFIRGFFKRRPS